MKVILLALLVIVALVIMFFVLGALAACMLSSKINQREEKWRRQINDNNDN